MISGCVYFDLQFKDNREIYNRLFNLLLWAFLFCCARPDQEIILFLSFSEALNWPNLSIATISWPWIKNVVSKSFKLSPRYNRIRTETNISPPLQSFMFWGGVSVLWPSHHCKDVESVNEHTHFSWTMLITYIATDRALFSSEKCWYLSYFSTKTYVVGTH